MLKNPSLYNEKSKKDLLEELKLESFKRLTCSFYRYVNIVNPNSFRNLLYEEWSALKIFGRVYVSNEGINAQISCPQHNWRSYNEKLNIHRVLKDIPKNFAVEEGNSFHKLVIKVKDEIVAYGLNTNEYDMNFVGKHLSAHEFNAAMNRPKSIIVDMRNYYESEVGKFKGAIVPSVETSRELLPEIKQLLKGKEETEILMYCTGGVRCEKASSFLIHNGFKNIKQLTGGIINYGHQVRNNNLESQFIGKNFVFDARLGERITDDVISNCHQCGGTSDNHIDCNNDACHILFIQCYKCSKKYEQCCSIECMEFNRLSEDEKRTLRKDPDQVVSMTRNSTSGKPRLIT